MDLLHSSAMQASRRWQTNLTIRCIYPIISGYYQAIPTRPSLTAVVFVAKEDVKLHLSRLTFKKPQLGMGLLLTHICSFPQQRLGLSEHANSRELHIRSWEVYVHCSPTSHTLVSLQLLCILPLHKLTSDILTSHGFCFFSPED